MGFGKHKKDVTFGLIRQEAISSMEGGVGSGVV